ncbi:LexA family transcriptional regulator [Bordetella sp. BOR01]|uniref:LexA family transcriptional regulator n=1 Tax=Bordetella sp. BOR01 TaxID=2854779 RepID=UPI001C48B5E0|nr:LexA family transcriptional regulator [Bordetella sp. BOR01]MBV7482498.1 LexA family transcriptional regulator [Bordetella sp. BOR01]
MLTGEQLGQAIRAAIKKKGVTQKAVAAEFGVTPPSVQDWLNRGVIGKDKLPKLWRYFSDVVGPDHWGLREWPAAPLVDDPQAEASAGLTALPHDSTSSVTISKYDTGGRMGAAGVELKDQPGVIESWRVSREWLEKNVRGYSQVNSLCIVTGFGDSMRPMFNPGDPLILDSSVNSVDFDAVYFFRVGNEGFIKRLQRVPGKGLLAISENPAYRDWAIDATMEFEVFGRVLKVWRSEDF